MRRASAAAVAAVLFAVSMQAASAPEVALAAADLAAAPAVAAVAAGALDFERVASTADSLSFSDSQPGREAVPTLDEGRGIVRAILQSRFGESALAGLLFDRRVILYLLLAAGLVLIGRLYQCGERCAVELPLPALAAGAGRTLPIVGDEHPIGRMSVRFSERAAAIAILMHLMLLGAWMLARDLPRPLAVGFVGHGPVIAMPSPRPIVETVQSILPAPLAPAPGVEVGLPEPVADWMGPDLTIADVGLDLPLRGSGAPGTGSGAGEPQGMLPRADGPVVAPPIPPIACPPFDPGVVPVLVHMPRPAYPEVARVAEIQGVVVLRLLVGEDGSVKDVQVTQGHPMLITAAVAAARAASFRPAMQQRRPVAVWVEFPVRFSLY